MWNHTEMHSIDSLILLYLGQKVHIQHRVNKNKLVNCRLLRLGSCDILEHGGKLVVDVPSFDACILAWGEVGVSASLHAISFLFKGASEHSEDTSSPDLCKGNTHIYIQRVFTQGSIPKYILISPASAVCICTFCPEYKRIKESI